MLLIDGAKYLEWTPEGEKAEQELENMVKEHAQDIFGKDSIYFDIKHKLKSKAGTGTIPDGYVITFGDKPQLHIIEIELSSHSYDHIISQITKIITCLKDLSTWNETAKTVRDEIAKDEFVAIKAKQAIKSGEVYEFLYDRISNLASLVIVIDKNREDVREGISNITHREIKMIEFQTFKRVGAEAVHAHLFEPLYEGEKRVEDGGGNGGDGGGQKQVTVRDLIEANIIKVGQEIYRIYKGQRFAGTILADGSIKLAHTGKEFSSLSTAAGGVTNTSENGWIEWYTKRENGKECKLDELRKEYRATHLSNP